MESFAARCSEVVSPYDVEIGHDHIAWTSLFKGLLQDLAQSAEPSAIAARIHETVSAASAAVAQRLAARHGLSRVALSGGCFNNALLLHSLSGRLQAAGLYVLVHRLLPAGDGGLALGQCAIAAARSLRDAVSAPNSG